MKTKEEIYQQIRIKKKAIEKSEKYQLGLRESLRCQIDTLEWVLE